MRPSLLAMRNLFMFCALPTMMGASPFTVFVFYLIFFDLLTYGFKIYDFIFYKLLCNQVM